MASRRPKRSARHYAVLAGIPLLVEEQATKAQHHAVLASEVARGPALANAETGHPQPNSPARPGAPGQYSKTAPPSLLLRLTADGPRVPLVIWARLFTMPAGFDASTSLAGTLLNAGGALYTASAASLSVTNAQTAAGPHRAPGAHTLDCT